MSFPRYPEYKESGLERLGLVPAHWGIYSLKRSVEGCVNGILGDEADGENDLAVIRVADFQRSKLRVGTKKLTYRSITDKEKEARKLRFGDLLIEKSGGGDKTLVGCVVLFEHDFGAVSSNFVARMRPLPAFNSNFLCYAFDSLYKGRVNYPSIKQTTGIQNLDSESYLQERFCFPTLTEQTQIARFLDHETAKIDTLIHEQKRLIELLKEKRQAVISHAVTKGLDPDVPMKDSGVEWLGEVPAHWRVMKFVHCVRIAEGQVDPTEEAFSKMPLIAPNHVESGTGRLLALETAEEQGASSGKYFCRAGDIVYSKIRPALRKACFAEQDSLCSADMYPLRSENGLDNQFLLWFLLSEPFSRLAVLESERVAMPKINRESLNEVQMVVPPFNEQSDIDKKISATTRELDELASIAKKTMCILTERRSALISAAVTGKIDVRNWQPSADESAFEEIARDGQEATV